MIGITAWHAIKGTAAVRILIFHALVKYSTQGLPGALDYYNRSRKERKYSSPVLAVLVSSLCSSLFSWEPKCTPSICARAPASLHSNLEQRRHSVSLSWTRHSIARKDSPSTALSTLLVPPPVSLLSYHECIPELDTVAATAFAKELSAVSKVAFNTELARNGRIVIVRPVVFLLVYVSLNADLKHRWA